jgi:crotonobetainyl-CoA:carnitine CoA-transferase CaiB-like acyl-CoA transferase
MVDEPGDDPTINPKIVGRRRSLVADLVAAAGMAPTKSALSFDGPDVVLPSSFAVTDAAVATTAAFTTAVAELASKLDGGQEAANVTVDSVATSVAFQSERHLVAPAGHDGGELLDPLLGHYRASDGYVQFHTNFSHHRAALLSATGTGPEPTRDDVAAVVATAGRFHWETAVAEAGGIAAAVRHLAEWEEHPHARHVGERPPILVSDLGSGTGERAKDLGRASPDRPLAGLRVLDLTRVIAGPVCTRSLAAYGADVLRIGGPALPVVDALLADTTLGKRFANLDLDTTAGVSAALDLAAGADVVVTGFRPGALAGKGLTTEAMLERNPELILADLSAFGPDGPWGGRRGFDSITQSATGIVDEESTALRSSGLLPDDAVRPLPCQLLDHGTGFLLALGVVSALLRRLDGAGGQRVEASLLTTRNWLVSLGRTDPTEGEGLSAANVEAWSQRRRTANGDMSHAAFPGVIDGVPARWDVGPTAPGADAAVWE